MALFWAAGCLPGTGGVEFSGAVPGQLPPELSGLGGGLWVTAAWPGALPVGLRLQREGASWLLPAAAGMAAVRMASGLAGTPVGFILLPSAWPAFGFTRC